MGSLSRIFMSLTAISLLISCESQETNPPDIKFDFDGSIYGEHLQVVFKRRIRDEKKFTGIDALKAQILKDIEQTKTYFNILS